jgi:muramoyltetrapeptide carboxypeptidase LdcA involved in peptidoglycan recycling
MTNSLTKPQKINKGDTIATISPSNGWAGDKDKLWKYTLGVKRLNELELNVIPAPNSLKGSEYLSQNPQARAEDIMWAFENKEIRAVISNVGGNDSIKIIPYINPNTIKQNPKIFIGYSDVMNLHILCYKCGLSSFYGDNLLHPIAEAQGWHPYSKMWFKKVLFDTLPIGIIKPSADWTYEDTEYINTNHIRKYYPNEGYQIIQGHGKVSGLLFGGHTGLMELENTSLELSADDYAGKILFIEDITEFFTPEGMAEFFQWLGNKGALQKLKGIVIGKLNQNISFDNHEKSILSVINNEFGLSELPIIYGLNFGHSSPMCVLPYGAIAEIDCEKKKFFILESGVV